MITNTRKKSGKSLVQGTDLTYVGPIKIPKGPSGVTSLLVNRTLSNNIISNGSGIVTNAYSSANVSSVNDWAALQEVWKEYRVLAMELTFIPIAASTTAPICLAIVGDHQATNVPLTAFTQACAFDNVKFISGGTGVQITTGKYPKYAIRASGVEALEFTPIGNAISAGAYYIHTFSTAGTNTVVYFQVLQTFTIEFRGSGAT